MAEYWREEKPPTECWVSVPHVVGCWWIQPNWINAPMHSCWPSMSNSTLQALPDVVSWQLLLATNLSMLLSCFHMSSTYTSCKAPTLDQLDSTQHPHLCNYQNLLHHWRMFDNDMALSSKLQVAEMCLYLLMLHLMALPMLSYLELLSAPVLHSTSLNVASYIPSCSLQMLLNPPPSMAILPSLLDLQDLVHSWWSSL